MNIIHYWFIKFCNEPICRKGPERRSGAFRLETNPAFSYDFECFLIYSNPQAYVAMRLTGLDAVSRGLDLTAEAGSLDVATRKR